MKCAICNCDIHGHYLVDHWQQAICAGHAVEYCSSCGRFVKPVDLHLADGRCICAYCQPSIVNHPSHIEWVEKRVRSILSSCGITNLPSDIPIRLVSPAEMANLTGSRQINLQQPGLTVTSRTATLLFSRCKHTIYIFNQVPKVWFAGILAHEMLHAWQNEKDIRLPSPLAEGFCNTGSYVVYNAIGNDLARHFIRNLEKDPNPIYGDGFRKVVEVYRRVKNLGEVMNLITHKIIQL